MKFFENFDIEHMSKWFDKAVFENGSLSYEQLFAKIIKDRNYRSFESPELQAVAVVYRKIDDELTDLTEVLDPEFKRRSNYLVPAKVTSISRVVDDGLQNSVKLLKRTMIEALFLKKHLEKQLRKEY